MANSATAKTALPIDIWGASLVTPVEVVLDTTGSDLTIYTPATGKMCAIVGINYAEADAHTLTFTSGTDPEFKFELGANSGISQGIGQEMLYVTQPGSVLKVQTSVAITGPIIFYIIEASRFQLGRGSHG